MVIIPDAQLLQIGSQITDGISQIIEQTKSSVAVYLNSEISMTYWRIGKLLATEIDNIGEEKYGSKIVSTVSTLLTKRFGKGYNKVSLFRMMKINRLYPEEMIMSTLSTQLTWSHLIELSFIAEPAKRLFYQQMSIANRWSVRTLRGQEDAMAYERSLIAAKPAEEQTKALSKVTEGEISPDIIIRNSYIVDFLGLEGEFSEEELEDAVVEQMEKFIMELGDDFAFLKRQKRISIDSTDYRLDLLFYHRKMRRLFAVDLKLGKFKPEYKGQMELYLKWLQRYEMQPGENTPVGLLLCSEGNTEHIELMMLDESNIKVAQYLTVLPDKKWFIDKLNRSIKIAKELKDRNE